MIAETDIDKVVDEVRRELESIKRDNPDVSFNVESGSFDLLEIVYNL